MAPNADQASEEAPGHYRHCQLEMLIKDLLDFNQRLVSCERMNFGSVIDFVGGRYVVWGCSVASTVCGLGETTEGIE
jgi:hypothetical protein